MIEWRDCNRCGHHWALLNPNKEPKMCPNPKCHSPYWNKERVRPLYVRKSKQEVNE